MGASTFPERPEDTLDWGDVFALFVADRFAAWTARELIAPSEFSAVEEESRDRFVATPLTSFSDSWVGSRLTNSFCSNCTTTYGRAWIEWTLSPRAWMSLTCNCPRESVEWVGEEPFEPVAEVVEDAVVLVLAEWAIDWGGEEPFVDDPEPSVACDDVCWASHLSCSTLRRDGGGLCILNSGA